MKKQKKKNRGFTLVEVLICVGIIGIIAAITIPSLVSSTSEKALEAQRKALHSRMAQAFAQIKNLKLYEQTTAELDEDTGDATGNQIDYGSAINFISQGLSKVYKISDACDATSIKECGVPDLIHDYWSDTQTYDYVLSNKMTLGGDTSGETSLNEKITVSNMGDFSTDFAAFKTANGESILLWYNPKCKSRSEVNQTNLIHSLCINMIYDLNGKNSAPNAYGEDIGYISVFYPNDPTVVMPILYHDADGLFSSSSFTSMLSNATTKELVPPTLEELTAILVNKNLTKITKDIDADELFWSSSYTSDSTSNAWVAGLNSGLKIQTASGTGAASHPYFLLKK